MKALSPAPFAILFALLFTGFMLACTGSDSEVPAEDTVPAGIGNDCGPADAREVWLRIPGSDADSNATQCPSSTLDGVRIRVLEGLSLDSLKAGTYTDLPARDCRDTVIHCPAFTATVRVLEVTPTEVTGTYELKDSAGGTHISRKAFKAQRCIVTPLCG